MAIVEEVRERQEEIVTRFQTQPFHRDQFAEAGKRLVANALREPRREHPLRRTPKRLPPPSKEAKDFILRAVGNLQYRRLIERLAGE